MTILDISWSTNRFTAWYANTNLSIILKFLIVQKMCFGRNINWNLT